jgi:hypothetical protein
VRDAARQLRPRPRAKLQLAVPGAEHELALQHVERLDVIAVQVRGRGFAGLEVRLADGDLADLREQHRARARSIVARAARDDHGLRRRQAAVGRRRLLVVDERAPVAQAAHEVREPAPGRVEVEVAQLRVAGVAKAVHDERRYARQRSRREHRGLALRAEPHGQLALEHVEEVAVTAMDVQIGAVAAGRERDQVACSASSSDRISTRRCVESPTISPPPGAITIALMTTVRRSA